MKTRSPANPEQLWLPGTLRCLWQEGPGRRWFPAVVVKDMGDTFMEVHVEDLGMRIGTTDRTREYPGYIRRVPRRRRT